MNNLNHENMDKYIDNGQEICNLPNVELMDTEDIKWLPLLIMSYYDDC